VARVGRAVQLRRELRAAVARARVGNYVPRTAAHDVVIDGGARGMVR